MARGLALLEEKGGSAWGLCTLGGTPSGGVQTGARDELAAFKDKTRGSKTVNEDLVEGRD